MNSTDRYERSIELFNQVCDLPEEKRDSFLADACGDDADLRRAVEMLVKHDSDAGTAVAAADQGEGMRALSAIAIGEDETTPKSIGQYRIVRKIGQGGMGIVYEAQQDHPRRTVALKVLHAGIVTANLQKRFRREADFLGRLQHPGIAQVYEAGVGEVETEAGSRGQQPFFAMELIAGQPLDQFVCDKNLSDRARLELLAKVCDGVQHAHERGVIHRDLKPSNILVTPGGQPKILDFGVSRATDADLNTVTMRTDTGQLVGTIPYMSPEQVYGDPLGLDERSDVYSLGVVLFELLAERLPQDVRNRPIAEAVRIIQDEDPTSLGSLDRRFRGDVETIVAKALEKAKERRYQSAAELAADIRRYLADEPVAARPASTLYQLQKLVSRHKALGGAIVGIFVALVFGLSLATVGFLSASRERDAKQLALHQEQVARASSEAVTEFLAEMLAATNPGKKGRDVTVREVLDDAATKIGTQFADQPLVEAKLRTTIGETYVSLSEYDRAEQQLLPAINVLRRVLGDDDVRVLDARAALGAIYYFQGRYKDAQTEFDYVHVHYADVLEPSDLRLVASTSDAAFIAMKLQHLERAEKLFLDALEIQERIVDSDDPVALELKANLAVLYLHLKRFDDAEAINLDVIERSRRIRGAEHPETILAVSNLASTYLFAKEFDKAIPFLEQALDSQTRILGENHSQTLITLRNLARAFQETKRFSEAGGLLREGLARSRATAGNEDRGTILLIQTLAWNCQETGESKAAEELLDESLRLSRTVFGDDARQAITAQAALANFYAERSDFERATPLAEDLINRVANSTDAVFPKLLRWRLLAAQCYVATGRFADAERVLIEAHNTASASDKQQTVTALIDLYDHWERPEVAEHWRAESKLSEIATPQD